MNVLWRHQVQDQRDDNLQRKLYLLLLILFFNSKCSSVDAIFLPECNSFDCFQTGLSAHTLHSLRGGVSESVSAWNVGSRHAGRPYPKFSSNLTTGQSSHMRDPDITVATKNAFANAFLNREDRNRFIARVYAILTGQLLFTALTIHAFHLNPDLRDWMLFSTNGRTVPLLALIVSSIACWITFSSENVRRSSPMRWPLLIAFTIGESITVGLISSLYAYTTVLKGMMITSAATISVTLYTIFQKNPQYDLSQWGRALFGLSLPFLMYGFIHVLELYGVVPYGLLPYSEAIYCIIGASLFSLYLAHHTRLIISGKSVKYQMNEKDYILGAMTIYNDIINIFLYLLRVLADKGNGDS